MGAIPINIADHVGRTPMVQLARLSPEGGGQVFGKLEMFNPGGSVKDRIGVAMIEAAEKEGRIEPGRTTIVEATSGNTGIALAFVCAAKGYELILTLPQGMSREREGLLRLYGAQVHITESMGGMNEAVAAARAMARDQDVFLPDQFSNPANPEVHRRTTGPEIWEAMDGKVDYFVAGVGTGGTITGTGAFLKERDKDVKVIAVEPATSAVLSGGRPGPAQDPGHRRGLRAAGAAARRARRDHRRRRRGRDRDRPPRRAARGRAVRDLLRRGAVGARSRSPSAPEAKGKRIVVVLPDSGERYVSTPFFAPEPTPAVAHDPRGRRAAGRAVGAAAARHARPARGRVRRAGRQPARRPVAAAAVRLPPARRRARPSRSRCRPSTSSRASPASSTCGSRAPRSSRRSSSAWTRCSPPASARTRSS